MKKFLALLLIVTVSTALATLLRSVSAQEGGEAPTIKKVMQQGMKGGLCKKVASGQASDAEKASLLAMFKALSAAQPPKGDADSWSTKTAALVGAAQAAVDGNAAAGASLRKAANCKACHAAHKPPAN